MLYDSEKKLQVVIYLDEDIRDSFLMKELRKSFWKHLKESVILEPGFNGIGIDLKKLFRN